MCLGNGAVEYPRDELRGIVVRGCYAAGGAAGGAVHIVTVVRREPHIVGDGCEIVEVD